MKDQNHQNKGNSNELLKIHLLVQYTFISIKTKKHKFETWKMYKKKKKIRYWLILEVGTKDLPHSWLLRTGRVSTYRKLGSGNSHYIHITKNIQKVSTGNTITPWKEYKVQKTIKNYLNHDLKILRKKHTPLGQRELKQ